MTAANIPRSDEYTFLVYKLLPRAAGVMSSDIGKMYYCAEMIPPHPPRDNISHLSLELLARDIVEMYIIRMPQEQTFDSHGALNIKYKLPSQRRFSFSYKNPLSLVYFHDFITLTPEEKYQFEHYLWQKWVDNHHLQYQVMERKL